MAQAMTAHRLEQLQALFSDSQWFKADEGQELLDEIERAWGEISAAHDVIFANYPQAVAPLATQVQGAIDDARKEAQRAAEEHNRRATTGGDWTPERVREARERCERATPGPWTSRETDAKRSWREIAGTRRPVIEASGFTRTKNGESEEIYGVWMRAEDAAFIAHAREDLPAALREIERLTGATANYKALLAAAEASGREVCDKLDQARAEIERLTAELAARAPAEASLEARAKDAKATYERNSGGKPAWFAVVRAVDASRPGGTMSPDWIRGVRAAADVAASYNRDSTHPYRLDDCILAKLNVGGEPRANEHASRPGFTEEARSGWFLAAAWARLAQARAGAMQAFDEDHEKTKAAREWLESIGVDVTADPPVVIPEALRASRGEPGPAPTWGEQAIAEHRRAADGITRVRVIEPPTLGPGIGGAPIRVRPTGLTSIMADAQQRPSVPPASPFGEWPEPERSGLTCPGCYAATGIATPCKGPLLSPAEQADPSFADALLVAQDRHREAAAVHPTTETDRQRSTLHAGDPLRCPGPNCKMCNGEACNKCGAGCWNNAAPYCAHGVDERHEAADYSTEEPSQ